MSMTLEEMLRKALTAEMGPESQTSGEDYDSTRHEILGKIPTSVQWLHEFSNQLEEEFKKLNEGIRQPQDAAAHELQHLQRSITAFNELKWTLLLRDVSAEPDRHDGFAILMGWKIAASLKLGERDDSHHERLVAGIGIVVGYLELGPRRCRRHDT